MDDPWRRIEAEKPQRDAARRAWDAERQRLLYGPGAARDTADGAGDRPDEPDPKAPSDSGDLAERVDDLVAELRTADLTRHQAAAKLEQLLASQQPPEGPPPEDRAADETRVYESPSDIRDALLGGRSVSDVRRDLVDQPDTPSEEPTTELVREQDGYRYELGRPEELPEEDELRRPTGDAAASRYDKLRREASRESLIEDSQDALKSISEPFGTFLDNRPPISTYSVSPDRPVVTEYRPHIDGGDAVAAVVTSALIIWLLVDRGSRVVHARIGSWRESKRGEQT